MTLLLYSYHQQQHQCCCVLDVRSANLSRAAPLCNDVCLCYTGAVCSWQIVPSKSVRQCTSSPTGMFVLDSQLAVPVVMSTFCKQLAHRTRLCLFFFLLFYKQLKFVVCSVSFSALCKLPDRKMFFHWSATQTESVFPSCEKQLLFCVLTALCCQTLPYAHQQRYINEDKIDPNADNLWYLQFYIFTIFCWL